MGLSIPLDDVNPEKLSGGDRPEAGNYHVLIVGADHYGGRNNEMLVDYEVLAGTTPGQEGKVHRDYYSKSEKAVGRILQLAVALGMTTVEELQRLKDAGKEPDLDFEKDGVGRQCCVAVENDEYEGKTRTKVNFGIWHVDDSRAATIPKHAAQLATFRKQYGVSEPTTAATTPAGQPVQAAGDFFGNV